LAVEHAERGGARFLRHGVGERQAGLARQLEHLVGGVGAARLLLQRSAGAQLAEQAGQPVEIDLAAPRMQVQVSHGQLGDLGEAAAEGEARQRMAAQVLEQATGEVAHVEHGDVG